MAGYGHFFYLYLIELIVAGKSFSRLWTSTKNLKSFVSLCAWVKFTIAL